MTDNVRLLNHDTDTLTFGGVAYAPDSSGAFVVPADVAAEVLGAGRGGFYRQDVAPAPAEKLAWNPNFGGVVLSNDLAGRVLVLELADSARLGLDDMAFVDSAGVVRRVLSTAECRALCGEYRARLIATL